jgi:hypothetical protein
MMRQIVLHATSANIFSHWWERIDMTAAGLTKKRVEFSYNSEGMDNLES